MTKFKVGDKVRITGLTIFDADHIGEIGAVTAVDKLLCVGGYGLYVEVGGRSRVYKYSDVEHAEPKSTKKQRLTDAERTITALESEVAELKAKVEALEKAQSKPPFTHINQFSVKSDADIPSITSQLAKLIEGETDKRRKKSPNEQRKAIIAEVKAFVEKYGGIVKVDETPFTSKNGDTIVKLFVNEKKRTVTAVPNLYHVNAEFTEDKRFAKCAPDDVFNADIGKAIALGRALGLDVSRFEQAVKPSGPKVGQIYRYQFMDRDEKQIITAVGGDFAKFKRISDDHTGQHELGRFKKGSTCGGYSVGLTLLDDTEAQY